MENIEIGHSCFSDINADPRVAGFNVTKQALDMIKSLPLKLVLVFLSDEYLLRKEGSKEVCRDVLDGIQKAIKQKTGGADVPLVGITTAAGIYKGLAEDSIIITALASKHLKAYVGIGGGVFDDCDNSDCPGYKKAVEQAYKSLGVDSHKDMDERKPGFLLMFPPGFHGLPNGEKLYFDHEIHQDVIKRLPPYPCAVVGCSAADSAEKRETSFQVVNDKIYEGHLALVYVQTGLRIGLGIAHGFNPTIHRLPIDKIREGDTGYIVEEIDGRPACEVLKEMEKEYGKGLALFGSVDLHNRPSVVFPQSCLEEDGSLVFVNRLSRFMTLNVMTADASTMRQAGQKALRMAIDNRELSAPRFALIFSCAGRREAFRKIGVDVNEVIEEMIAAFPEIPIMIGGFGYGEQGMDGTRTNVCSNWNVATLVLDNELTPRAKREYGLDVLNETSQRMLRSDSLNKAVKGLLNGLQEIGYDGAMLSLVYEEWGTIEAMDAVGRNWKKIVPI